jgi:hypothetical protein
MIGIVLLAVYAIQVDDRALRNKVLAFSWVFFTIIPLGLFMISQTTRLPATVATIGMLLVWGAAAVSVAQVRVTLPADDVTRQQVEGNRLRLLVETRQHRH